MDCVKGEEQYPTVHEGSGEDFNLRGYSPVKGQVSIFTISNCPHCIRCKHLLLHKNYNPVEINLATFPERRTGMILLSGKTTVPQVFFNNYYIGNADDVEDLNRLGDLDVLHERYISQEDFGYKFLPPTMGDPSQEMEVLRPRRMSHGEEARDMSSPHTFSSEMASARPASSGGTTENRLSIFLTPTCGMVCPEKGDVLDRDSFYAGVYELKEHDETRIYSYSNLSREEAVQVHEDVFILNTAIVWTQKPAKNYPLIHHLHMLLEDLEDQYRDRDGTVDYVALAKDDKYLDFRIATCELQQVDMLRAADSSRVAFFINVYNLVVKHALIQLGLPGDNLARLRFFSKAGYCLGGFRYTLNDIEHGILRGNRRPPYGMTKPFRFKDQREDLMVRQLDCRIHFALNCGASSCPVVRIYDEENIEDELSLAARAFCDDSNNVLVDSDNRALHLSKIFFWYQSDFSPQSGYGSSEGLQILMQWCSEKKRESLKDLISCATEGKLKIRFIKYDWSPQSGKYSRFK